MRAILITNLEAKALLDQLELQAMRNANHWPASSPETHEIMQAHRAFHFIVTKWLQEVGADLKR
jgi:uncharacterized protein YqcC (DUF446 family)